MTTYYIRATGSNANNGTSPATAWQTISKAGLTPVTGGDVIYVGAGIYRITMNVSISPSTEVQIIGDVDGTKTGDVGEIRVTSYDGSDFGTPGATSCVQFNGNDHFTFKNIVFVGGNAADAATIDASTAISTDIKFLDCTFLPNYNHHDAITVVGGTSGSSPSTGIALNWTFDRCRFLMIKQKLIHITLPQATNAYDANILIQNCLFLGGGESEGTTGNGAVIIDSSGSDSNHGGGIRVQNCTYIGCGNFVTTSNVDTTLYPVYVFNCIDTGGDIRASASGEIVEDYNMLFTALRYNVSTGSNSVDKSYSLLLHIGQELAQGKYGRPLGTPTVDSPLLSFGGTKTPTYDIMNAPRPAGSGVFWLTNSTAIGVYEFGNCGLKETTTFNSTPTSMRIKGPGWHDFDFPVDPNQMTISIQVRITSAYAGSKPQMFLINGTECGVADANTQMTAGANTWQQLNLTFTPTSTGIITIRLQSNDSGIGDTYFDDFAVS